MEAEQHLINIAARGDLNLLIEFNKNHPTTENDDIIIKNAIKVAAKNGHLNIVKWLVRDEKRFEKFYRNYIFDEKEEVNAIDYAAGNGHLNIVKFLYYNGKHFSINAMNYAAKNGHLDVVKWLKNHRIRGTVKAMDWAAAYGHIKILEYLYSNGYEYSYLGVKWTIENGQLESLKWLHTHKTYYDEFSISNYTFYRAAVKRHLHIIKWMQDNIKRCPNLMDLSAEKGDLYTLHWLRENGYQCTTDAMDWPFKYCKVVSTK